MLQRQAGPRPHAVKSPDGRGRFFARKSDAKNAAQDQEALIRAERWVDPAHSSTTLAAWAEEVMSSRLHLRPSTQARDESYLRSHLLPAFGDAPLAAVERRLIQSWVRSLTEEKGLAPRTVRECYRILSGLMSAAVDERLIAESPCRRVSLPRVEHVERRFLNASEIETLVDAIDYRYRGLVYVGAYCGLRWGELAGLKREHLDIDKRRINVVGSLERVGNGFRYVEETKTTSGRRMVPVPGFLVKILAEHLLATQSVFVFPAPRGDHLYYQSWRRRFWNPAVEASGLAPLTPHSLRHTAAALMIDQGANPVTVQRRLGHGDIRTTLQLYGHRFPEQDDVLTARLEALRASVAK